MIGRKMEYHMLATMVHNIVTFNHRKILIVRTDVEVDYMNGHRPIGGTTVFGAGSAIEDVRRAFRNAAVSNPNTSTGITLFVQLDENITHQDTTTLNDFINNIKPKWFGTAAERADPNNATLLAAKRMAFHYAIFAHDQPGGVFWIIWCS
jgi:hypothetical protein